MGTTGVNRDWSKQTEATATLFGQDLSRLTKAHTAITGTHPSSYSRYSAQCLVYRKLNTCLPNHAGPWQRGQLPMRKIGIFYLFYSLA